MLILVLVTYVLPGPETLLHAGLPAIGTETPPTAKDDTPGRAEHPKHDTPGRADRPSMEFRTIRFEENSYRLVGAKTFETLNDVAGVLSRELLDQKLFLIIGYSDAGELLGFSIELSLLRAGSVLNYLAEKGVARDRLYPLGYGMLHPVNPDHPYNPFNRRVVIVNMSE
jgi:outer membrane protein OmpA-like peptidoglycan-associated protein